MKVLGWILTVLGCMLCFGALVQLVNGELMIDKLALGAIGISVAVLVLGVMILKHKK
jgi:hypothetical protein